MRTLILHQGALGDALLLLPLLHALPRPRHLLLGGRFVALFKHLKACEVVEDIDALRYTALFTDEPTDAKAVLPEADQILDLATCGTTLRIACQTTATTYHHLVIRQQSRPCHQALYYLRQMMDDPDEALGRYLRSMPEPASGDQVLLHPGSGGAAKCWPGEKYLELTDRLTRRGRAVRVILGPAELERYPPERLDAFRGLAPTIEWPALVDLARRLAAAGTYIGNDSGVSHLAAVCGARCLVLFGPTDPAVWRPVGPVVKTVRRRPLERLSVEDVCSAARLLSDG